MLRDGDSKSDEGIETLVEELSWAESVVVTAEALLRRLPHHDRLAAKLLDDCLASEPDSSAPLTKSGQVHTSSSAGAAAHKIDQAPILDLEDSSTEGQHSTAAGKEGQLQTGIILDDVRDRRLLCALLQNQPPVDPAAEQPAPQQSGRADLPRRRSSTDELSVGDWGLPLQTVRLLECECKGPSEQLTLNSGSKPGHEQRQLLHRLYARVRPGEMRISSVAMLEQ